MNDSMIYLETGSTDPRYNLAFEETVLSKRREGNYLILWQNHNAVIIGRSQNTAAEVNQPYIDRHGIRVVRRGTGGGAVYHDLGNLNYSFICDAGTAETLQKDRFALPVLRALQKLGLEAELSGRNDILVSGRKVSGTAQQILGSRILYHGTLLFHSDLDVISHALQVDPSKFRAKGITSVRGRVGNIRQFLREDMDMSAFRAHIKKELLRGSTAEDALSHRELAEVSRLAREKYDSWEWNYGHSPQLEYTNRQRFPGGLLEIRLAAAAGRIEQIKFYGDFLSTHPTEAVEQALLGCPLQPEAVGAVLARFPISCHFGAITREQIIGTLFGACPAVPSLP